MRVWRSGRVLRCGLTALLMLSAVLFGFAHRFAAQPIAPDLSAFAMPDGSMPVLCQTGTDGSAPTGVHDDCPACRLVHEGFPAPETVDAALEYAPSGPEPTIGVTPPALVSVSHWRARAPPRS